MTGLAATAHYERMNARAVDQTGAPLAGIDVSFDIDFGAGAITNGELNIVDTVDTVDATGNIRGVFVGTSATPAFVSGFVLQADGLANAVQGLVTLEVPP